ncbi:MAG TPA: M48 family peptidase, partial [Nitrospirales bacterium]|nr:M48 family peptidase [Nitrospirales bacterium]
MMASWKMRLLPSVAIPLLLVIAVATTTCQKAPVTGRDQLIFYSEEKEIEMGLGAFRGFLRDAPLSNDPELLALVNRVGDRIAAVADKPEYD